MLVIFYFYAFIFPEIQGLQFNYYLTRDTSYKLPHESLQKTVEILIKEGALNEKDKEDIHEIPVDGTNPTQILAKLCDIYNECINNGKVPFVFDVTLTGVPSEIVQAFTAGLSIPAVSTSYGQKSNIRAWRNLEDEEEKYQVHIMCPADILAQIVRSFIEYQNFTNAMILYDSQFEMEHKKFALLAQLPTRYDMKPAEMDNLKEQININKELGYKNFFFLGSLKNICTFLRMVEVSELLTDLEYQWVVISLDAAPLECECDGGTVFYVHPIPIKDFESLPKEIDVPLDQQPITTAFYIDVMIWSFLAVQKLINEGKMLTSKDFVKCHDFSTKIIRSDLDLRQAIKDVYKSRPSYYAPFLIDRNGNNYMRFKAIIEQNIFREHSVVSKDVIGSWEATLLGPLNVTKEVLPIKGFPPTYRVSVNLQPPFVMKATQNDKVVYYGFCIDLLNKIKEKNLFNYVIEETTSNGYMQEDGQWNGIVGELINKRADIGLSAISVLTEREAVIDFTLPFYPRVGITIMMKKNQPVTSLFKFLTVLERDVWLCILGAYFLTSTLLWVFDRYSPYSYQNNKEKYRDDDEKRVFGFRESLWFCMTSLTPQGGGEAPKNLSGRLVAATWWLFGFIIIASYTANLAAFLTVSRLDTNIASIDDLAKQYKIQYAPVNGTLEMRYFKRMADIEHRFYEIWKDMSLNDSLTPLERSKLAVWDYPVSDKFTRMWQAMIETTLPSSVEEAVQKVKQSKSASDGFALLGDATDVRYYYETNCDLQIVGPEFSAKPYAIALQSGSTLVDKFNQVIQDLMKQRYLEDLSVKWWTNISTRDTCDTLQEETDGISIRNIGGVFIVIVLGITFALSTLIAEYWWYRCRKSKTPQGGLVKVNPASEKEMQAKWSTTDYENYPRRRGGLRGLPPVNKTNC